MKKIKNILHVLQIVILLLVGNACVAQDEGGDFKKIALKYQNTSSVMLTQQINYYETYTSKKPLETNNTVLKQKGQQLYMNAFNMETLIVDGVSVVVDHESKIIILDKKNSEKVDAGLAIDFETIIELSSKTDYKKAGKKGCYTFYFEKGEQLKTEVWYSKESFEVTKIVFYMRNNFPEEANVEKNKKPSRLEILIIAYKTNCDFASSTFDIHQYLMSSNHEILPSTNYKEYKLINNIRN